MRATRSVDGAWSLETLLQGKQINCFAVDPRDSRIVFAGTQGNGILRSEDRGKTWQPAGMDEQVVKSLAVSASEADTLYAGTKPPAVFVSHNAGETWTELESFRQMREPSWKTPTESEPYVLGLAVSPTDSNVILAGVEYGAVLRSADAGKTWQGHLKDTSKDCHSLIFHPTDGNWAYQGGGGWPAAVSRDGGVTWQQPRRGMGWSLYGWAVAADPERPEIWYVSSAPYGTFPYFWMFPTAHWDGHAHASIFRSIPDGRWKRLSGGLPQPLNYMAYALLTDPAAPGHLYAGLSNGDVWHTDDYGEAWQQLPFNLGRIVRSMVALEAK
ncbi:MAG TPA: hypothetical protein VI524_15235 [Anaerolineales bacterium]|nr:hypothetical protein [Anaerolineales bacterium]